MSFLHKKQKNNTGRKPLQQTGKPRAAFSYYAGEPETKQGSVRARHAAERREAIVRKLRSVPSLIIILVIFMSVVYSTTLSTKPGLVFSGGDSPYRSVQEYSKQSQAILSSSIFNRDKLTLNATATGSALAKAFPELDVVTVTIPVIGRRPTVTMHVRQPALILTTTTNAYVLDASGKIIATASEIPSSVKDTLLTVQDHSGLQVHIGSQVLTTEAVEFLTNVKAQLADKKLEVSQAILPAVPNEVDIYIKNQAYYLKTDTSGDVRLQIGAYLAAKQSGVAPKEYMDLRVAEKVFYK